MSTITPGFVPSWRRIGGEHPSLALSRGTLVVLAAGFGLLGVAGVSIPFDARMVVYLAGMIGLNLPHGGTNTSRTSGSAGPTSGSGTSRATSPPSRASWGSSWSPRWPGWRSR